MMTRIWSASAVAALLSVSAIPSAALAASAPRQSVPAISVGTAVVDEAGNPVGHIASLQGEDVIVRTDLHEARIPRSSLWPSQGRLILGMTRAQLNAAVERLAPAPPPTPASVQIAPGVIVRGSGGAVAGTIEAVNPNHVILRLSSGLQITIPRDAVGTNAQGAIISVTAEELQRLVEESASTPGTAATPATTTD